MLAPTVVRAGVARTPRGSGSTNAGHRRAATSAGNGGMLTHHLRPALLPPMQRSSLSTSSNDPTRHLDMPLDLPNTPSSQTAADPAFFQRSNFSSHPSAQSLQPHPYPSPSSALPSLDEPKSPWPTLPITPRITRQALGGKDATLRMSGLRLRFTRPQVEADFHVYLERSRSRTLPLLYTALMWSLGLIEVVVDSIALASDQDTADAKNRLALMLTVLCGITLQTLFRQVLDEKRMAALRKQIWVSLIILITMTLCSLSWTLATHTGLDQTNKVAIFIVFLQLYILGRRPLLFLEAALVSACSTCIFVGLLVAYPAPVESAASLTSHVIVLFIHLFWLIHMHQQMEYQQRLQYAEALQVAWLKREKETLDHDTKALKGEFFQLTLERFDIADVEEEGKVLTSAMEQAMGKLQMLGKKQDLPADVLKEIMKVISLLGSGSDLFKAKMEGSDWKNGLYGGDDELTRYIYETLNGEAGVGATRSTPRVAVHSPSLAPGRLSTEAAAMLPIDEEASRSHTHSITGLSDIETGGRPTATFMPASTTSQYDRSLSTLLHQLDDWNLDIFEVATLTQGKPLFFIGMALFKKYGMIDAFHLDKVKLSNFLRELEGGYYRTNPYHNSAHAADVARSVHWFVRCGKMRHYCQELEVFALIIASLAHDFQHPGKNNAYHIAISDDKALLYNDRSVLENFHASQMFTLLLNPALNANFLAPLPTKDFQQVRKLIVGLVLATDLAHSNEFLGRFKNFWAAMEATEVMGGASEISLSSPSKPRADLKLRPIFQSSVVKELEGEARLMVMKMALKCADIGHSAKRLVLHEKWTARITEEFYRQGDEERRQGLPISPFMDRRKANLSASQLGFMDWIVLPLYTAWFKFLDPEERRQREMWVEAVKGEDGRVGVDGDDERVTVMEQLRKNREFWRTWQGPVGGEAEVKDEVVSRNNSPGRQWTLSPLTEPLGFSSRASAPAPTSASLLTISVSSRATVEEPLSPDGLAT